MKTKLLFRNALYMLATLVVLSCGKTDDVVPDKDKDTGNPNTGGGGTNTVTGISFNNASMSITLGDNTNTLTVNHNPVSATAPSYTWSSADASVATVDANGKITTVKVGSTVITARARALNLSATITINVVANDVAPTAIALTPAKTNLAIGEKVAITYTLTPTNATGIAAADIEWTSSNTAIATVNNGEVTAVAAGSVDITAKIKNTNISNKVTLTVVSNAIAVTAINVSPSNPTVNLNETLQLTATVVPTNATNQTVTFSSTASNVATVSATGLVTGKSAGTTNINCTVINHDGGRITKIVSVTVVIPLESIAFNTSADNVAIGGSLNLSILFTPSNASNKGVTYSSSNTATATVSAAGVVTGKAEGTVTITARASDGGKVATKSITVVKPAITSIGFDKATLNLALGQSYKPLVNFYPFNAADDMVYESSVPGVAVVDQNGNITPVANGTTIIKAYSAANPSVHGTTSLTVRNITDLITVTQTKSTIKLVDNKTNIDCTFNVENSSHAAVILLDYTLKNENGTVKAAAVSLSNINPVGGYLSTPISFTLFGAVGRETMHLRIKTANGETKEIVKTIVNLGK